MPRTSRQHGFSLLEVLVSIVIIAVGALGAAGMQINALKNTGSANDRYRAASLASAMVDTLRANRTEAVTGNANFVSAVAAGSCTGTPNTKITGWQNQIACELPNGKGGVAINAFTKRATVTVEWNDARGNAGNTAQQFVLESRL